MSSNDGQAPRAIRRATLQALVIAATGAITFDGMTCAAAGAVALAVNP